MLKVFRPSAFKKFSIQMVSCSRSRRSRLKGSSLRLKGCIGALDGDARSRIDLVLATSSQAGADRTQLADQTGARLGPANQ
jgi:hypothetical protein